jgi:hypothetical protein
MWRCFTIAGSPSLNSETQILALPLAKVRNMGIAMLFAMLPDLLTQNVSMMQVISAANAMWKLQMPARVRFEPRLSLSIIRLCYSSDTQSYFRLHYLWVASRCCPVTRTCKICRCHCGFSLFLASSSNFMFSRSISILFPKACLSFYIIRTGSMISLPEFPSVPAHWHFQQQ